jgi:hypothetical protein
VKEKTFYSSRSGNCQTWVTEGKVIKNREGFSDVKYSIKGDTVYLEPFMQDDMNKIKEIFSLTPEEKKELDRIVGESLEEYRTSL